MNILFPFKKLSSKSMHSDELQMHSDYEIDDVMENRRNITLNGMCSYQDCICSTASVGDHMYLMSVMGPVADKTIGMDGIHYQEFFGNGMTIVGDCGIDLQ